VRVLTPSLEVSRDCSGVPGMAARVAGARNVVLTEQDELLRLMDVNLRANASALVGVRAGNIVARPLSWGEAQTRAYLDEFADEPVDVVLSCDCIYEPLYGESWRDLARTMEIICARYPRCVVLMGVERRNQDGIDKFLAFVDEHTTLQCELHERAEGTTNNRLELYYLKAATA
jgi:predicted nicotinamide N-methyase